MKKILLITATLFSAFISNAQTDSLGNLSTSSRPNSLNSIQSLTSFTCSDAVAQWIPIPNIFTGEIDIVPCSIGSALIGVDPNGTLPVGGRIHSLATSGTTVRKNIVYERTGIANAFATQLSTNASGNPICIIGHSTIMAQGINIESTGNLGIGTYAPTQKLDVAGGIKASGLAGTGNRMVIANSTGVLSTQAIPTDAQTLTWNATTRVLGISSGNTVTIATGADNLGNHTATQDLNMNTKIIQGIFKLKFSDNTEQDVASPWKKSTNAYYTDERVKLGGGGSGTDINYRFEVLDGASRFGNVGINTISPNGSYALEVSGDAGKTTGGTSWQSLSDARLKNVLGSINNSLEIISKLNPVKYTWNEARIKKFGPDKPGQKFGFLAQELQKVIPEFVTEDKEGTLWYNPSGIEAILVAAIQEQQILIDKYYSELQEIKNCCSEVNMSQFNESFRNQITNNVTQSNYEQLSLDKLYQNKPNPFSNETVIDYEINNQSSNASLLIYDMQGKQLKKVTNLSKGTGSVIIQSGELYPGMFMYSLVIDGKEIDTKRMIIND